MEAGPLSELFQLFADGEVAAEGVRFCVEDDAVEIQGGFGSEEEIEVFERLGEVEAFHGVGFLLGADVVECCVRIWGAAIFNEVVEVGLAHLKILSIVGRVVEIVGGFDDLGPQGISWRNDLHFGVVESLGLDAGEIPHFEA